MKVLHVIPSLSPKHGGTSSLIPLMAGSLANAGLKVDVATTDDDGPGHRFEDLTNQRVERDGYGVYYFRKQTEFYKISLPFRKWIAGHVSDYDLVHVHVMFSYTSNSAARFARGLGVPYLISPHGVLNGWGMKNRRRLIKALSFQFVEKPILRYAAAMHYTSRAEQREAEQAGATAPAAVIPLGIDTTVLKNLPGPETFLNRFPQAKGRTLILFLSRLDAKKGLDLLLPVFAETRRKHPLAVLVIAGSGEEGYVAGLRDHADRLGLTGDIIWTGFLGGVDKLSALAAATVFILPSYSENFGIALMEAMAAGLPCLTTPGVALAEDVQARAADVLMVVPAEVKPLAAALGQLLGDAALRARLGANAKRMAAGQFTISSMGAAFKKLYAEIAQSPKQHP
jgi:glycosyltransferase involved in cell wall biosynthesis